MKKIILALIIVTATSLVTGCCGSGSCGTSYCGDSCCGCSGIGNWY